MGRGKKSKAEGREVHVKCIERLEESFVRRVLSPWGTFVLQNGVPRDTPDPSLSLRRRTWVEANLFIRSFLPGGNTYRTFRAPFVKRVAGRTLTAHSNVLRIYVARFPAFPLPSHRPPFAASTSPVTTFPSPFKLTTLVPPFRRSVRPSRVSRGGIPPLRGPFQRAPFCKETDFSTPSL